MNSSSSFDFFVIGGDVIQDIIGQNHATVIQRVQEAYRLNGAHQSINPDSYFLRFPDKPNARIIALPAYLGGDFDIAGIKWIASFPDNIHQGIPRASAVLVLNDYKTGYPIACLESSIISAARTAASAVLGADWLMQRKRQARKVGFVGNGIISRYIADFFLSTGWEFGSVCLYDLDRTYSESLGAYIQGRKPIEVSYAASAEELVSSSDLVVFTTTAPSPYVSDPALFQHNPVVLNISLRDLAPEIILAADNVVDDIDHCLKAATSPHLAEQRVGHRNFINGTLDELIRGEFQLSANRTRIFSPFGMGILDLALGAYVYEQALAKDRAIKIPNFFHERTRW